MFNGYYFKNALVSNKKSEESVERSLPELAELPHEAPLEGNLYKNLALLLRNE